MRVLAGVTMLLAAFGCGRSEVYRDCGDACADVKPPVSSSCPANGAVTGRVCATDGVTWVNGASVTLAAVDCRLAGVVRTATTAADGSFRLDGVPPGSWTMKAQSGSFTRETPVTVRAGETTAVPDDGFCLMQGPVKIAVVTGSGDKIENLLDQLQLQYTLIRGDGTHWDSTGAPFLGDLGRMKEFNLIFVDCAAAHAAGSTTVDFGAGAALIEANLRDYALGGGSLYASDWALLFADYAAPGAFSFATQSGDDVANPVDTHQLMGFAPQTLQATVTDPSLAAFLGKSSLSIKFPNQQGAVSSHWGLINAVSNGELLVRADGVQTCADASCFSPGPTRDGVPLFVWAHVLPPEAHGGNVVYTSFHNIAQSGGDVGQLLKYLVLHL